VAVLSLPGFGAFVLASTVAGVRLLRGGAPRRAA
jgi:hypothetical protein